jgi:hypothetical protein
MTDQETTVDIEALKAEAKALDVKGWQATKDPDKLIAKIEEAKSMRTEVAEKRSTAPKMKVFNAGENTRNQVIARLEKADPDCKYLTQKAGISADELASKGLELVKQDNGEVMYHGGDVICRTDKNSYYEWQNSRTEYSLKGMKSIDKDLDTEGGGRKIQSLKEQAKSGMGSDE